MNAHPLEQLVGFLMLLVWGVWRLYVIAGRRIDRHVHRAMDAFDAHWDDVAALFPPAPADELAARRVRGDTR